jgi:hypothetical protein
LQAIVNKFFPDIAMEDARTEEKFYKDLGQTPPPDSMKRSRPEPAQVVLQGADDIRFRLRLVDPTLPPIDRKFVFNAPRSAMLRKVVPFLQQWLDQKGYGKGSLTFYRNDVIIPDTSTFVSLFGDTAGTQQSPETIDFNITRPTNPEAPTNANEK